jgi:hypothetical protein
VGSSTDWDPADTAARLAATQVQFPTFAWTHRGRALALLRANDLWGAEAALTTVTGNPWPVDEAIRGLIGVTRGDVAAARDHLLRAEKLIAAHTPSENNPFAYADSHWADRLDAVILITELRSAVDPTVAPPPRRVPPKP